MSADLFAIFGAPDKAPQEQNHQTWNSPKSLTPSSGIPRSREPVSVGVDVLFDADAEDDFGDFEDVEAVNQTSIVSGITPQHAVNGPNVASASEQFDLLDLGNHGSKGQEQEQLRVPSSPHMQISIPTHDADDWGDFEDSPRDVQSDLKTVADSVAVRDSTFPQPATNLSNSEEADWDDFDEWNTDSVPNQNTISNENISAVALPRPEMPDEPRPTNIPPPMMLLQLLPVVFQSIHDQATVSQNLSEIDETAASIVTVFAVSARIIAGRALRWKRDTYLAQSSRIGPATAGSRSGGMKLTAVNKSEAIREEREAADVCDAWSRNTHVFAGVVTKSEHRRPWMNLNIKMTPRPSPGFGTLEARDPCALCGIRRDERIAGVDFDVDDVFNEYWTEHWGHSDCKVFWYTYRDMLDHR